MPNKAPGNKGPMGKEAHRDEGRPTQANEVTDKKDADLQEDLQESFPGSDALTDTRRTNDEK